MAIKNYQVFKSDGDSSIDVLLEKDQIVLEKRENYTQSGGVFPNWGQQILMNRQNLLDILQKRVLKPTTFCESYKDATTAPERRG